MARSLALDLARVAGAAWRDAAGDIRTCTFALGKPTAKREELLSRLFDRLERLLDEVRPDLVTIEDDTGRGAGARTLRAYHAVAELCAARRGIPARVDICASRARATALGHGKLTKEEAVGAGRSLLGLTGTDDEVDAAILLVATEILLDQESYAAARRTLRKGRSTPVKKRAA